MAPATGQPRPDRTLAALLLICMVGALAALVRGGEGAAPGPSGDGENALTAMLGAGNAPSGFKRATGPQPFTFPADHGAHPDYRSEWWYLTGNLEAADGHQFGVQLTFFRFALAPTPPESASVWATRQAWMAHFAVTDVDAGTFSGFERFERGAAGLAGAEVGDGVRVWLDDWAIKANAGGLFPLSLHASEQGVSLALTARRQKPRILQGQEGYSHKGGPPGNASYYYSYPRLGAEGRLRVNGQRYLVSGTLWMDREWGTSALAANEVGWDWFALQLDDGRDVMLYRLRQASGGTAPASAAVVIGDDGNTTHLGAEAFRLEETRWWRSPTSGRRYPVSWRVQLPGLGLDLDVAARLDDQEMGTGIRYWEGSVSAHSRGDGPDGLGYLEMTGY